MIVLIVLLVIVIALLVTNIRIVPQANAYVIERLGAYAGTWEVGLHVKIPLIDKIAKKVSLKEHVIDFPPQPVITKDNVTMEIDTVIYFQITDPKLFTYGVANPMAAIENLSATTLRNIIGDLELDESLTSREIINSKIRIVLDEALGHVEFLAHTHHFLRVVHRRRLVVLAVMQNGPFGHNNLLRSYPHFELKT